MSINYEISSNCLFFWLLSIDFLFISNKTISSYVAKDSNSLKIYFQKVKKNPKLQYSKDMYIAKQKFSLTFKIFIKDKQILSFPLFYHN